MSASDLRKNVFFTLTGYQVYFRENLGACLSQCLTLSPEERRTRKKRAEKLVKTDERPKNESARGGRRGATVVNDPNRFRASAVLTERSLGTSE